MVAGAIDMVLGSEFGNATFGVVKAAGLAPGSLLIETQFVVVCPAPRGLNVQRFVPRSSLRVVVDAAGEDVSAARSSAWFDEALRDVPLATAQKVASRMRDRIAAQVDHAAHMAEVQQEGLVRQAVQRMNAQFEGEIARLRQLARVNPNIREDEITHLEQQRRDFERYLRGAQLKFDAVRIAVAT